MSELGWLLKPSLITAPHFTVSKQKRKSCKWATLTQHHQAINKPPPGLCTSLAATHRWGQASWGPAPQPRLFSLSPGRAGRSLEAAGRGGRSSQGVHSSPPARRKPSGCGVPFSRCSCRWKGSFAPVLALSSWQTCCLLPAPALSNPLQLPTHGQGLAFLCLCTRNWARLLSRQEGEEVAGGAEAKGTRSYPYRCQRGEKKQMKNHRPLP